MFEENPGRQWLNQFLADPVVSETDHSDHPNGGLFLDSFRCFHPAQKNAFTCWCTVSGARQTNYGTRIDYILANRKLVETEFMDSIIMPDVEGSDHCPVKALMKCCPLAADKCPSLCTKYLPEFAGRQQKLFQFLVKKKDLEVSTGDAKELSSSPSSSEGSEPSSSRKRTIEKVSGNNSKKGKPGSKGGQGSLLGFFKPVVPKSTPVSEGQNNSKPVSETKNVTVMTQDSAPAPTTGTPNGNQQQSAFWKTLLKGPPPPPNCKGHGEPCVLRTVKKDGPNCGRQFFVCARPVGHSSNPLARCNFFLWVNKKSGVDG